MILSFVVITIIAKTLFQLVEELPSNNFSYGSIPDQNPTDNNITLNLSNNTGHSELPNVVVNGNKVYVVWADDTRGNRDIYFRKSTNYGCSFDDAVNIGNQSGGSVDPQIAVSGKNLYVVWEHSPENNGAVFFTRSTDNGATFEKIKNIGNNTGYNGFPQLAASGNNVYLIWHDATDGIFFTRSTDNGATFEKIKNIGNNTGYNGFPQLAASGNDVYIMWTNNFQEKYGQIFFTKSSDNGTTFDIPLELTEPKDIVRHRLVFNPQIAVEPRTKTVFAVWHSGRIVHQETYDYNVLISDVLYKRSSDNGATFDSMINLSNKSGWSTNPQIAVSQNNVYVVWTNNAQEKYGQIFFTKSSDNGATFDSMINLSNKSGWSTNPQIAVSQNNVYVVWTNNAQEKYGQIFFTKSSDNGATFDSMINLSNKSGWSTNPQIAVSEDNVYVVWTNNATGNEETILKSNMISGGCSWNHGNSFNTMNEGDSNSTSTDERSLKMAFIDPTFTFAAYDKSFYLFYAMNDKTSDKYSNITEDVDLFSSIVPGNYEHFIETDEVMEHLKWLIPKSNIERLTDQDVDAGSIFRNGANNMILLYLDIKNM